MAEKHITDEHGLVFSFLGAFIELDENSIQPVVVFSTAPGRWPPEAEILRHFFAKK